MDQQPQQIAATDRDTCADGHNGTPALQPAMATISSPGQPAEVPPKREPSCEPPHLAQPVTDILCRIQQMRERPLFALIAHIIDDDACEAVYEWRKELKEIGGGDNLDILIYSPGGVLTSCYRMARLFARYTNEWQALVPGLAASGATLICLGSSSIILSDVGQLGPV